MADTMQIRTTAEKYVMALNDGDLDSIMSLYSADATVEDPVGGGKVLRGTEEIKAFYETVVALNLVAELREVRVCGTELLFHFILTTTFDDGNSSTIDVWDLMQLDDSDDPEVTSMKAYWNEENMS